MSKKSHQQCPRPRFDLNLIISLVIIMATTLGATIPLYLHTSSQMQTFHNEIHLEIKAIHDEMKDFHGRLCAIEERNKNK